MSEADSIQLQLFEALSRKVDPREAEAQEKAAKERLQEQYKQAQTRMTGLVCPSDLSVTT
jgi:hypothetical protein